MAAKQTLSTENEQGTSAENEHWEVVAFDGADTLCLARFAQRILNEVDVCKQCVVFVEGVFRESGEKAGIVARPLKGEVDGYVRNITVKEIPTGDDWTVGCRGATLEDIKADKVSFFFFGVGKELHLRIADSLFAFNLRNQGEEITPDNFDFLIKYMQIHPAIAVAKKRKDSQELRRLWRLIEKELGIKEVDGLDATEMVADGFRIVEATCASERDSARSATTELTRYVESSIHESELPNAIIYAIESLGCVARGWPETRRMLSQLLEEVLGIVSRRKKAGRIEGDIVWASLVALKKAECREFNKSMLEDRALKRMIKQHRFKDILEAVRKEVIGAEYGNEGPLRESSDTHSLACKRPKEQEVDHVYSYFLSYSRKNTKAADYVELFLRRQGQKVLRDLNDIPPGAKLRAEIKAMIAGSDTFIALWSEVYDHSRYCNYELEYALECRDKLQKPSRIILITLDKTEPPFAFVGDLRLDGHNTTSIERAVENVVKNQ